MVAYLKLVRVQNLLIVAITQYIMRFAIIEPILKIYSFSLQMREVNFAILVLSTMCLTAAGYVINDYFDTKTDSLNRPKEVIVGQSISRRMAMALHIILNIIGVLGGFYVSYQVGHIKFGFIFILVTGILWYYSTNYKRQFLIGNLIVSFLTGLVPLLVILYEMPLLNIAYADVLIQNGFTLNPIFYWILGFSFFAFVTTLIREIIKDTEDFDGDKEYGRHTLPIVLGIKWTKIIVVLLSLIVMLAMGIIYQLYLKGSKLTFWYLLLALEVPFLFLVYKIIAAKEKKDYHLISLLLKFIMLFGLLYALIAAYIFLYTFSS
ncbi:MAG: geranylgeranylglycerol-phosphate geranylgeranyltransferase [Bacteroidales bacterium]